jgi:hypothetical protein
MFVYDSAAFGSDVLLCTFEESHVEGDPPLNTKSSLVYSNVRQSQIETVLYC